MSDVSKGFFARVIDVLIWLFWKGHPEDKPGDDPRPSEDTSIELPVVYAHLGADELALIGSKPLARGGRLILRYSGERPTPRFEGGAEPLNLVSVPEQGGEGDGMVEAVYEVKPDAAYKRYFFRMTYEDSGISEVPFHHFLQVAEGGGRETIFSLSRTENQTKLTLSVYLQPKTWVQVAYEEFSTDKPDGARKVYVYYQSLLTGEEGGFQFPDYLEIGPRQVQTIPSRFDGQTMRVLASFTPPDSGIDEVVGGDDAVLEIPPPESCPPD